MNKSLIISALLSVVALISLTSCGSGSGQSNSETTAQNESSSVSQESPLNLSIFVDLSDRIMKENNNMKQEEIDKIILNDLASKFYDKNAKKFALSQDIFQIVFYPAPKGSQSIAKNLVLELNQLKTIPEKRKALLGFKENISNGVGELYSSAVKSDNFFGSDIWGYFSKDKVKDLYNEGYRNVLIIITDGYIYDANNKIKQGNNFSYILPSTLSIPNSGLIPCKITHPDIEVYVIECNTNPKTEYPKMKSVIENWIKGMGIEKYDIQDSDIPANTIKHLEKEIFK